MSVVQAVGPILIIAVTTLWVIELRKSHRASVARLALDLDVVTAARDRYLTRLEDLVGVGADQHDARTPLVDLDDAAREVARWQDRARAALGAFRVVDAQRAAAEDRVAALEEEIVEIGKMTTVRILALEAEIAEMTKARVDFTGKVA